MSRASLAAVAGAVLLAGGLWTRPPGAPALVVEDASRDRVLHREHVAPGQTFVVSYVHSSERVPVRGLFRVEPDRSLTAVETAFGGFGPGLPSPAAGDAWTYRNGLIVARGAGPTLPEVRLRVNAVARQRLELPSGLDLDLATLVAEGAAVTIRVR